MIDLLEVAIDFEKKTATFYRDLLPLIQPGSRHELVEGLLHAEEKHVAELKAFKKKLGQEAYYPVRPMVPWPAELEFLDFAAMDYPTLLKTAMKIEDCGLQFYQGMADSAPNEVIKDFFTALANFERAHIDILTQEMIRG